MNYIGANELRYIYAGQINPARLGAKDATLHEGGLDVDKVGTISFPLFHKTSHEVLLFLNIGPATTTLHTISNILLVFLVSATWRSIGNFFFLVFITEIGNRRRLNFADEIEIHLYDGTGQYPGLQDLAEDTTAFGHTPKLFSNEAHESEHGFKDFDLPEPQSDISYTFEELSSWDLLSEPSDPYAPIISPRELIQSSPAPNTPGQDLQVPVPAPDTEIALAVGSALSLPGNLCNGKCKGDLSYVVFPINPSIEY